MKLIYIILLVQLLANGCISSKGFCQSVVEQEFIQNVILDFSSKSKFYKKDVVFSISIQDTLYKMVLEELNDGTFKWVESGIFEGLIAVRISANNNNKFLLSPEAKVGSKGKLPSQFIEKEGKLFFWWDDDYPLTHETLAVLKKYDLLQENENDIITIPDFVINDAQKGVHYYFCRGNISKYKRIITNKGMGFYDPPNLNCN